MAALINPDKVGHAFGQNPDTRNTDKANLPLPPKGGEGLAASFVRLECPAETTTKSRSDRDGRGVRSSNVTGSTKSSITDVAGRAPAIDHDREVLHD